MSWPEELIIPSPIDQSFQGFEEPAFEILDRLKAHPRIEQYREDKEAIKKFITEPFKVFRDDVVVNWVLPNGLALETERNVFSRLLKNDFGAGGCHHHIWMSFYRPGFRRLTDIQLAHSLSPSGFSTSLYVGDYAKEGVERARASMLAVSSSSLTAVNELLERGWVFRYQCRKEWILLKGPIGAWPADVEKATGFSIRKVLGREKAAGAGEAVVRFALNGIQCVWPLYRAWILGDG